MSLLRRYPVRGCFQKGNQSEQKPASACSRDQPPTPWNLLDRARQIAHASVANYQRAIRHIPFIPRQCYVPSRSLSLCVPGHSRRRSCSPRRRSTSSPPGAQTLTQAEKQNAAKRNLRSKRKCGPSFPWKHLEYSLYAPQQKASQSGIRISHQKLAPSSCPRAIYRHGTKSSGTCSILGSAIHPAHLGLPSNQLRPHPLNEPGAL